MKALCKNEREAESRLADEPGLWRHGRPSVSRKPRASIRGRTLLDLESAMLRSNEEMAMLLAGKESHAAPRGWVFPTLMMVTTSVLSRRRASTRSIGPFHKVIYE